MTQNRKRGAPVTIDWLKSNCVENAETGCWEWARSLSSKGYGRTRYQGRKVGVHRIAYILSNGAISADLCVLHKCDNRPCCNPQHLFVGTNLDNVRDMIQKDRHVWVSGEDNGSAKLTSEQVLAIRSSTGSCTAKATAFGVNKSTIARVLTGQTWSHLLAA